MAQSRHPDRVGECPLSGVKRTLQIGAAMSVYDPEPTWNGGNRRVTGGYGTFPGSLRLDASEFDDFRPLFSFSSDEPLAFGGRHGHRCYSEVSKPCFESWI